MYLQGQLDADKMIIFLFNENAIFFYTFWQASNDCGGDDVCVGVGGVKREKIRLMPLLLSVSLSFCPWVISFLVSN